MITDTTLFKGLLKINSDNISQYMQDIIEQKEPDLLKKWFGYELAKDIQSDTPSTEAQKLIDGFEFTDSSGDLEEVIGLKKILPYFMYFYIVRQQQTSNTTTGERLAATENSEFSSPAQKMINNYNFGVDELNFMLEYLNDNTDTYNTYVFSGYLDNINTFGV